MLKLVNNKVEKYITIYFPLYIILHLKINKNQIYIIINMNEYQYINIDIHWQYIDIFPYYHVFKKV